MFALTLQLSAAAGFHGNSWGKQGPQGFCFGATGERKTVTCAMPRAALGPKFSIIYSKAFIICHLFWSACGLMNILKPL